MKEFTKKRRLNTKYDYANVFMQKRKFTTQDFIFVYSYNNTGHSRLGLALSKKVIAKAHDRNRIKRVIRETFRNSQLAGIDVVVLVKNKYIKTDDVSVRLHDAWNRLQVLCSR